MVFWRKFDMSEGRSMWFESWDWKRHNTTVVANTEIGSTVASGTATAGLALAMWTFGASAGLSFALPILVPAGLIALGLSAAAKFAHAATLNRYKWKTKGDRKDDDRSALNSLENQEISEGFLLTAATLVGAGAIHIQAVTALGATAGLTLFSLGVGIHALHELIRAIAQYRQAGKQLSQMQLNALASQHEDVEDSTTTGQNQQLANTEDLRVLQGANKKRQSSLQNEVSQEEVARRRQEAFHLMISSSAKLLGAAVIGIGSVMITAPIAPALIAAGFGAVAVSHIYNNGVRATLFGEADKPLERERSFRYEMENRSLRRLA
jgi:hypothetical protein